jgi:site-specific DNA-methyltransferase (adenine-specific)
MKPYYEHGGVTIYHGDCRDVLPELTADVVITDPPYGLGELTGTEAIRRGKNLYGSTFEDTEEYVQIVVVPSLLEALARCGGRGAVTPGVRCSGFYPRPRDVGGFYQPAAVGMGPWGFASFNPVLFYGTDPFAGKHVTATMVPLTERASDDRHPCAKPISACRWLIAKASKPNETVLDPFMGIGTFLVAAKDMYRKAIGIEIHEAYCEIAAKRLAQEALPFEAATGLLDQEVK